MYRNILNLNYGTVNNSTHVVINRTSHIVTNTISKEITNPVNKLDPYPLAYAIKNQNINEVKFLLKAGTNPNNAVYSISDIDNQNERNKGSTTHLILAAAIGNTEIMSLLLIYGADLEAYDWNGYTALMTAVVKEHLGAIQFLLSKNVLINKCNHIGSTALHLAVMHDLPEIANYLVFHGAYINCILKAAPYKGATSLIFLAKNTTMPSNSTEILNIFLSSKELDLEIRDSSGMTALAYAVKNDHNKMAKLLIKAGANVNWENHERLDCLLFAIQNNNIDLVKILLKKGALVEKKHNDQINLLISQHYSQALSLENFDPFGYLNIPTGNKYIEAGENNNLEIIKEIINIKQININNLTITTPSTTFNIINEEASLTGISSDVDV